MKPLSRTVGENRVVDELIVSFTHDREMRVYLPRAAPTVGRWSYRMQVHRGVPCERRR